MTNVELLHLMMKTFSALDDTFAEKQREHAAMCTDHGADPDEILRVSGFRISFNDIHKGKVSACWDISPLESTYEPLSEGNNQ